ncbi:hypothetical protein [Paenibacillus lupini]|nr:hypothetical protein [Paenibacillus lupini]NIK21319.1 hypothetical protein [Paenibacillus lupini]
MRKLARIAVSTVIVAVILLFVLLCLGGILFFSGVWYEASFM